MTSLKVVILTLRLTTYTSCFINKQFDYNSVTSCQATPFRIQQQPSTDIYLSLEFSNTLLQLFI